MKLPLFSFRDFCPLFELGLELANKSLGWNRCTQIRSRRCWCVDFDTQDDIPAHQIRFMEFLWNSQTHSNPIFKNSKLTAASGGCARRHVTPTGSPWPRTPSSTIPSRARPSCNSVSLMAPPGWTTPRSAAVSLTEGAFRGGARAEPKRGNEAPVVGIADLQRERARTVFWAVRETMVDSMTTAPVQSPHPWQILKRQVASGGRHRRLCQVVKRPRNPKTLAQFFRLGLALVGPFGGLLFSWACRA